MKVTRFLVSLLFLGATASLSFAQGAVSINWTSCTGPINLNTTGGSPVDAYVSVLGQSLPHSAYQIQTTGGSGANGPIRDAWRFDPTGCEGSLLFTLNHLAPKAVQSTCPSFQGTLASLQIKDYGFDPLTGKVKIILDNAYPDGITTVNAAQRYFLANYHFDLTFATVGPTPPDLSTCGGVEVPVCWHITSASWLSFPDGAEIPWALSQEFITSNDPNNSTQCPGATPAAARTWGSVKNQYRN